MSGLQEPLFRIFEKQVADIAEDVNGQFQMLRDAIWSKTNADTNIRDEVDHLYEVRDIREEIAMVNSVLSQQQETWCDMLKDLSSKFPEEHLHNLVPEPRMCSFSRRLETLNSHVTQVEQSINQLISLKQSEAGLQEARTASTQGIAVLVFTVFTVVFTPLSFMVSLYAVNIIDLFPQSTDSAGGNTFGWRDIARRTGRPD